MTNAATAVLTLDDVIQAAHAKGYSFDEVALAMRQLRDDELDDCTYWHEREPAALLAAVRGAYTPAPQADLPGCGSHAIRV